MRYVRSTLVYLLLLHSILASAGNIAWRFGGSNYEGNTRMACDAAGNLYITGEFTGTTSWSSLGGDSATSAGGQDIYVLKLNMAGTLQWSRTFGGTSSEFVNGIAVDAAGNVCITGSFGSPSINFGGGARSRTGSSDMYVVKLDKNGNRVWDYTRGGSGYLAGRGIEVDTPGNVYVAGIINEPIDFGGGTRSPWGSANIFIVKLNGATAAHMASGLIGGNSIGDLAQSVVVFRNYVYVSGYYASTTSLDFDPGPGSYSPGPPRGSNDAFITRLTNSTLVLPVRLLEFSARREPSAGALLDWSVAEEEGIAAYVIERSTDGSAFQPVAAVPATNSPEITHNYTFTDPSAPASLVYYRLRIAAVDGSVTYSPVRALQGTAETVDNRVYPTVLQAGGTVHVRYSGEQPQLTLCDAVGRVMQLTAEQAGSGLLMCTVPAQLQPGVYTLSLSSSQGLSSHRIVCR